MWYIFGKRLMWEVPGNCNEVMSLLQMSSDHFWEERRIVISEVCHHLNKTQKEFCLKKRESPRMHWKRSRTSFARWTYSSEKITEKVGKKLKWLSMKPINNLNHRHWSYIKQTSGLTELKKEFGDFSTKNRINQEPHARDCQEMDE